MLWSQKTKMIKLKPNCRLRVLPKQDSMRMTIIIMLIRWYWLTRVIQWRIYKYDLVLDIVLSSESGRPWNTGLVPGRPRAGFIGNCY